MTPVGHGHSHSHTHTHRCQRSCDLCPRLLSDSDTLSPSSLVHEQVSLDDEAWTTVAIINSIVHLVKRDGSHGVGHGGRVPWCGRESKRVISIVDWKGREREDRSRRQVRRASVSTPRPTLKDRRRGFCRDTRVGDAQLINYSTSRHLSLPRHMLRR